MELPNQPDARAATAARIRELRTERRLTQEEVAQRAGVSVYTVQNLESGQVTPRHKTRRLIAAALGVSEDQLEAAAS